MRLLYRMLVVNKNEDLTLSKNIWFIKRIPIHIAKIMMDDKQKKINSLLRTLSFDDYDYFSDYELTTIVNEINELIKQGLLVKEEMQEIIDLIQFAIDNDKEIMFDPFKGSFGEIT